MIFRRLMFLALLGAACAAAPVAAQTPDAGVAFGNHLTLANIVSSLQASGYQALVTQIPPTAQAPNGGPLTPPPTLLGIITTGINGVKVILMANRCPNSKTDDVCSITFFAAFTDNKNLMTDANLMILNGKASMVKVLPQKKDNVTTGFTLFYNYVCKDLEDPKVINPVLMSFGADMGVTITAYNALGTPTPPAK